MIRPIHNDPFLDDEKVLIALRQARASAAARAAAKGQPLIDWVDGQLVTTDAVITVIKEKGKTPAGAGGMDMDY